VILAYQRTTHFPTRTGNVRFRVDDDGSVLVQVNRDEPAAGRDWSSDYPSTPAATIADARSRIATVMTRHGFAALPARSDGDLDDGFEEQLTYDDGSGPRTVVVDGGSLPAFRALVSDLMSTLGITDAAA
jgi:hypothetical protein